MSKIVTRGFKGFGSSHAYHPRHVTNLGKSKVETLADIERKAEMEDMIEDEDFKDVKTSTAFNKTSSEKMKISEKRIRKIIREEIIKEIKLPRLPGGYYIPGDERASYDITKSAAGDAARAVSDAAVDTAKATGAFISDTGEFVWDGTKWVAGELYDIGAVVGGAMWDGAKWVVIDVPNSEFVRSWTRFAIPGGYLDPTYQDDAIAAWKEVNTRELGNPGGPTTSYITNINNKFTNPEAGDFYDRYFQNEDFSALKGELKSSHQLSTTSAENAIDMFYKSAKDGGNMDTFQNPSSALDFNGDSWPEYEGKLYWGPGSAMDRYQPQYIWLAKKLLDYGYDTEDKIMKLLGGWRTPGTYTNPVEKEEYEHQDGWVSPYQIQKSIAEDETRKILKRISMLKGNPDRWRFGVYYCERDMEIIRNYLDAQSQLAPIGTRWIFDALDMSANEGYQDCYLVHYTDDPRFLTQKRRMAFRVKA